MIDPEQIIEAADPALVRRAAPWRILLRSWPALVALAGLPWLWAQAGEHGHRTAVAWGLAIMVPVVLGMWWGRAPQSPQLPSRRWAAIRTGSSVGELALIFWLVQRDEIGAPGSVLLGWAVACVATAVPAFILRVTRSLGAWRPSQRAQTRARLARAIARSSDGPAAAILMQWRDRLRTPVASQLEVVAELETLPRPNPGRSRIGRAGWGCAGKIAQPDTLGPGVRRQLPSGGWLLAQVGGDGCDVTVTNSDGISLELSGVWRRVGRIRRWGAHSRTAVVARIASGPTYLVTSTYLDGGTPPSPRWRHVVSPGRGRAPGLPGDEEPLGPIALRAAFASTTTIPFGVACLAPGDEGDAPVVEPVLEPVLAPRPAAGTPAPSRLEAAQRTATGVPVAPRTELDAPGRPAQFQPLVDAVREQLGDEQLLLGPCPRLDGLPAITLRAATGGRIVEVARLPGSRFSVVIAEDLPFCVHFMTPPGGWDDEAAVVVDLLLGREEHPVAEDGRIGVKAGKAVVWPATAPPAG